ncbi:MAG TPA: hypothetical protein VII09_08985, partial [Opitutaceae bacterium]
RCEGQGRLEGRRQRVAAEGLRGADEAMSGAAQGRGLSPSQWRRVALISAAAAALFVIVRELPTGTNLSHMDFRVQGGNVIEFCDPANPQFLPVVSVRSPVTLSVVPAAPARAGEEAHLALTLTTFSGKPIAPEDLQVVQAKRIHLLIVDPSLDDYQHVHPVPGTRPGEWTFAFRPRFGGAYRIFADFTPVATNRGLYAETELPVDGPPNPVAAGTQPPSWAARVGEYSFALAPGSLPIHAGVPANLRLTVTRVGGGPVPLQPVMNAFAHLVAFDVQRSGFAHIHPNETDLAHLPDPVAPAFTFRVTIPSPGRFVIWSQVDLAGSEAFAPFWFDVAPRP